MTCNLLLLLLSIYFYLNYEYMQNADKLECDKS